MSMPDQVPESSMEEIFASIRKIISEDESKADRSQQSRTASDEGQPKSNVSPLFADKPVNAASDARSDLDDIGRTTSRLLENAGRLLARDQRPTLSKPAEAVAVRSPPGDIARPSQPNPRNERLSSFPRTEAATVNQGGGRSATAQPTGTRSVEQLAADLMRPMISDWLENNLPPLVERLVREEIARVARKRAEQ